LLREDGRVARTQQCPGQQTDARGIDDPSVQCQRVS
jgi:hypothetical protein